MYRPPTKEPDPGPFNSSDPPEPVYHTFDMSLVAQQTHPTEADHLRRIENGPARRAAEAEVARACGTMS